MFLEELNTIGTRSDSCIFFAIIIYCDFLGIAKVGYRAVDCCLHTYVVQNVVSIILLLDDHLLTLLVPDTGCSVKQSAWKGINTTIDQFENWN